MKAKQFKKQSGVRALVADIHHWMRTSSKGKTEEQKKEKKEIEISMMEIAKLSFQIRSEVEPTIIQEQEAYERLTKKFEKQGYVFDLEKYNVVYSFNPNGIEPDLGRENDAIGGAMFTAGATRAENDSRRSADRI